MFVAEQFKRLSNCMKSWLGRGFSFTRLPALFIAQGPDSTKFALWMNTRPFNIDGGIRLQVRVIIGLLDMQAHNSPGATSKITWGT